MNISWYDCELLRSILKRELRKTEAELECMRLVVQGKGMRCYLPPQLANSPLETVEENINPWCSTVMQITGLIEEFTREERRQMAEIEATKGLPRD